MLLPMNGLALALTHRLPNQLRLTLGVVIRGDRVIPQAIQRNLLTIGVPATVTRGQTMAVLLEEEEEVVLEDREHVLK